MDQTVNEFLNSKVFCEMHPKKKEVIKELICNTQGKKTDECLPHLMKANMILRKLNMSFSPEESAQIFLLLTSDMPADKKEKLKSILKM